MSYQRRSIHGQPPAGRSINRGCFLPHYFDNFPRSPDHTFDNSVKCFLPHNLSSRYSSRHHLSLPALFNNILLPPIRLNHLPWQNSPATILSFLAYFLPFDVAYLRKTSLIFNPLRSKTFRKKSLGSSKYKFNVDVSEISQKLDLFWTGSNSTQKSLRCLSVQSRTSWHSSGFVTFTWETILSANVLRAQ